jgi:hypothetical protein
MDWNKSKMYFLFAQKLKTLNANQCTFFFSQSHPFDLNTINWLRYEFGKKKKVTVVWPFFEIWSPLVILKITFCDHVDHLLKIKTFSFFDNYNYRTSYWLDPGITIKMKGNY